MADIRFVLHPNAHVTATMRQALGGCRGIELVDPCGHSAMLELMRDADLILSDSGGMQEEAPGLGVPLLVLRDKTERSEGIASGNARLVGTDPQQISGAKSSGCCAIPPRSRRWPGALSPMATVLPRRASPGLSKNG